jgi:ABC-type dipeptide/oligopeptide/nickel transport system permease subunit
VTTAARAKKGAKVQRAESPWAQARRRFFAGRQGPWGLAILGVVFFLVVVGPIFAPYRVGEIPKPSEYVFLGRGPSFEHIFGETAQLQLDVFMLVVNGGRASLFIGFAAAVGSITIGTLVGIIAGYFGGRLDSLLMRIVDVFLAIPSLFVIIVGAKILSALGGTGLQTVIIVFIVFGWMGTARLVRGQVLALREMEFIEAAQASNGYTLVGMFEGKTCLALIGFRYLIDLAHGKHLYVDDLVVTQSCRSKGFGATLLRYAEEEARRENCRGLRLCTGVGNEKAKRFYEQNGWHKRSVAYKKSVIA